MIRETKNSAKGAAEKKKIEGVDKRLAKRADKKMSEYGKQLFEKQKVKRIYGLRERQFRRFFELAVRAEGAPGHNLLNMLERRIDNVVYRLKMAVTRQQARQIVVHGHILVNGSKVTSPSYFVSPGDIISLHERADKKEKFLEQVVDKRLKMGIKTPEWLELQKTERSGTVLRMPVRSDIQLPIEEHLIVELYSK